MDNPDKIYIAGGISYLGFNILKWYIHNRDSNVYIITRDRSISRRPRLHDIIKTFPNVNIVSYPSLTNKYIRNIVSKYGCPRILYCLIGTMYGNIDNLYQSNAILPARLIYSFIRNCEYSLIIFVSSFYPSLSERTRYISEETYHLNGLYPYSHYEASKALGEMLIHRLYDKMGGKILILRPGIILGAYPYHIEWHLLNLLSALKIGINDDRPFPLTIAKDIAVVSEFLYSKLRSTSRFINWFYVTPYNISLYGLQKLLFKGNLFLRVGFNNWLYKISLPRNGLGEFLKSIIKYKGAYYIPRNLIKLNFTSWGSLSSVLTDLKLWLNKTSIIDSIKPFFT